MREPILSEINQEHSTSNDDFAVRFNIDRLRWMEEQLKTADDGYWHQDLWPSSNSPYGSILFQEKRKVNPHAVNWNFAKFSSLEVFKTEIKYYFYAKLRDGRLKPSTVFGHQKDMVFGMREFFNSVLKTHTKYYSFLEINLAQWCFLLEEYTLKKGNSIKSEAPKKDYIDGGISVQYGRPDRRLVIIRSLYSFLSDVYDLREWWLRDVWYLDRIGRSTPSLKTIRFGEISQPWLKQTAKNYLYFLFQENLSISCLMQPLKAFRSLSAYLYKNHAGIYPEQITRSTMEGYIREIKAQHPDSATVQDHLVSIKTFLGRNQTHNWVKLSSVLLHPDDIPSRKRRTSELGEDKHIPEEVVTQILEHLSELPITLQRFFIIFVNVGCRISELIACEYNCLVEDGRTEDGKQRWRFKYFQNKTNSWNVIRIASIYHPIDQIYQAIRDQQEWVKAEFGGKCNLLFPFPRASRNGFFRPYSYTWFLRQIRDLIYRNNICDINGTLWNFNPHQCRHAVGMKLVADESVGIIGGMAYLGHSSPEMFLWYGRLTAKEVTRRIEIFSKKRQVLNYQAQFVDIENDPQYAENYNKIKKDGTIKAQGVPLDIGICLLPIVLAPCDNHHKCLNCHRFITTPDYLPILEKRYKALLYTKRQLENHGAARTRTYEDTQEVVDQYAALIIGLGGDPDSMKSTSEGIEPAYIELQLQSLMSTLGLSDISQLITVLKDLVDNEAKQRPDVQQVLHEKRIDRGEQNLGA
jgi:integrase